MEKRPKINKQDLILSTQLGLQFALACCLFGGLGYYLDLRFTLFPVLTLIFSCLGFAAGLYFIVKAAGKKR